MARPLPRRVTLLAPLALLAGLAALSCLDSGTGPDGRFAGRLALVPQFETAASGLVTISRIRITLRRTADNAVALDTAIALTLGSDSVDLSLSVTLLTASETFLLSMAFVTPAGETAFVAGPTTVTATSGGTTTKAVAVKPQYVGVGASAKGVRALSFNPTVLSNDTVTLVAEAFDSADVAIPGTPIGWEAVDAARLVVPDRASGRAVGGLQRGIARVRAYLLTGPADTVGVLVQPRPVRAVVVSGASQTASILTQLPKAIQLVVKAADSLGVAGVPVRFSASGGGLLDVDSAATDATGLVSAHWTLGPTAGLQTLTARVRASLPESVLTVGATAVPGPIATVNITPKFDTLTTPGDTSRFTALARDAGNNLIPGASFTWTSSNLAVALVDNTGLALAAGLGTAQIIARAGGIADTALLTISAPIPGASSFVWTSRTRSGRK